jgi:hypothetical protein
MTSTCSQRLLRWSATPSGEAVLITLFFIVATLCIFPHVLSGNALVNGEYLYNFEPWYHYRGSDQGFYNRILSDPIDWPNIYYHIEQLQRGELPLWGHNEQLGKPGIFLMNNLLCDPIRLLLWVVFGVPIGQTIEILFKFIVGGVFSYYYLRLLRVHPLLALSTSVGFIYGSSQIASYLDAFAFAALALPMGFYLIEKLCQTNTWKWTLFFALYCYYVASLGAAHVVFFSVFWVSLYLTGRLLSQRDNRIALSVKFGVAGVFSVCWFGIYLFQTAEYFLKGVNLGYREGYGVTQVLANSLNTFFSGYIFGHPLRDYENWHYGTFVNTGVFVGFLTSLTFLVGATIRVITRRDFQTTFFVFASLVLLCHIYELPFERLEVLFNQLPLFRGNPPHHLTTYIQVFVFLGGALGLQYLFELGIEKRRKLSLFITLGAAGYTIYALWSLVTFFQVGKSSEVRTFHFYSSVFLVEFFLISILSFLWLNRTRYPRLTALPLYLLPLAFVWEAKINSEGWVPWMKPSRWFPPTQTTDFLRERIKEGRVMPLDFVAVPETLAHYGFPVPVGRGSVPRGLGVLLLGVNQRAYSHPTQTLFDLADTDVTNQLWKLLDVRYFVTSRDKAPEALTPLAPVFSIHRLPCSTLLERRDKNTHAFLADDLILAQGGEAISEVFYQPGFDISQHVIAENLPQVVVPGDSPVRDRVELNPPGRIGRVQENGTTTIIRGRARRPSYLILSQYYYPGWKAYLNGDEVPIFSAYSFLPAITVPEKGKFEVVFQYEPASLWYGALLSGGSLLLAIPFFWILISRERLWSSSSTSLPAPIRPSVT